MLSTNAHGHISPSYSSYGSNRRNISISDSQKQRGQSMSDEAFQRKLKIDMIGAKLKQNVDRFAEMQKEIEHKVDSNKYRLINKKLTSDINYSRYNDRYENKYDDPNERSFKTNPYIEREERPIKPAAYTHLDERPIKPSKTPVNDRIIGIGVNTSDKIENNEVRRRIGSHIDTLHELNNSKLSSNMVGSVNDSHLAQSVVINQKSYLRKRSTMKYDPMKASKAAKAAKANLSSINTSNIEKEYQNKKETNKLSSSLVDSDSCIIRAEKRAEFRKGDSNSQIIHQAKSMNTGIPTISQDLSKPVNSKEYKSVTKIPSISASKSKAKAKKNGNLTSNLLF